MKQGKLCLGPAMRIWSLTSLTNSIPSQLEQVEMLSQRCLWKPPWSTFSTYYATTSMIPPTRALSLTSSLPYLGRLDSILLSDSSRLPDMTPWEPCWLFNIHAQQGSAFFHHSPSSPSPLGLDLSG